MTTEHHLWRTLPPLVGPDPRPATCRCGQELDTCAGRRCPRCGSSLAAGAA